MTRAERFIVKLRKQEQKASNGKLETVVVSTTAYNADAITNGWVEKDEQGDYVLTKEGRRHSWKVEPGESEYMTGDEYQALLGVIG